MMRVWILSITLMLLAGATLAQPNIIEIELAGTGPFTLAPCGADPIPQIDVWVYYSNGEPYELLATDLWLEGESVAFPCGYAYADSSTYPPDIGHTTFSGVRRGGLELGADCAEIAMLVRVLGIPSEVFSWGINSPDLDADGTVGIADFGIFATSFNGNNPCADLDETNGDVTVADLAYFAGWFNDCECE